MFSNKAVAATILLTALLVVSCTLPSVEPGGYALIYGISLYDIGYPEGAGNNLTYADDDAIAVASMFQDMNYQVTVRTNAQATLANLRADIAATEDLIGPGENFIFYFSGHGVRSLAGGITSSGNEPAERDESDEWIFFYGSVDYGSITDITAALSDDGIQDLLSQLPTRRRIVILDACNSGGFIGNQLEIDSVPQDSDGSNGEGLLEAVRKYLTVPTTPDVDLPSSDTLVIAASGEQEDTYESSIYEHGVFTYFFLDTPTAGDANGDGYITTGECFAYVSDMISTSWNAPSFQPRISGGPVDFVLFSAQSP